MILKCGRYLHPTTKYAYVTHCMHKSALLPLPALGAVNHSPHSHNNFQAEAQR